MSRDFFFFCAFHNNMQHADQHECRRTCNITEHLLHLCSALINVDHSFALPRIPSGFLVSLMFCNEGLKKKKQIKLSLANNMYNWGEYLFMYLFNYSFMNNICIYRLNNSVIYCNSRLCFFGITCTDESLMF